MILSEVRTRAKRVALKLTVPSLFNRMFIDTRRCKQVKIYFTTNCRVSQCLSPCPNWVHPTPLPQASVSSPAPPESKVGGSNTRLRGERVGGPNSDDWRESLSLCLLCATKHRSKERCPFVELAPLVDTAENRQSRKL
jgi:hypothetical protein